MKAVVVAALIALGGWQVASAWKDARDGHVARRPWPWADMRPVARLTVPSRHIELFVLDNASNRALAFGPVRWAPRVRSSGWWSRVR